MQNDGGIQYVPQISAAEKQVIYLDFDGEETKYTNQDLDLTLNVTVENSGLSDKRIKEITEQLNRQYADENIEFVTTVPVTGEYSTVYVGNTEAFEPYGEFYGLAETVDVDNQIKNDNAFVILDQSYSNAEIISVIAHETGHIVSGETHDDTTETLNDYALDKLLTTQTSSYTIMVDGKTPNTSAESKYWSPNFPSGATKVYVTVTNNGTNGIRNAAQWNTDIYLYGITGSRFVVQEKQSVSFTLYAEDFNNIEITRSNYLITDAPWPSYKYLYGYVKNSVTITAKYYQNIPIADLKITSASFSKTALDTLRFTPSENFTYSFTVKNIGDLNAGASKAFIYVDGAKYAEVAIAALAAGASKSYSYTFAAGKLENGKHSIKVVADATGIVNEDNENNNDSSATEFIIEPAKADLAIKSFQVHNNDGQNISISKDIKVTATIQNRSANKSSVQTGVSLYINGQWQKTFTVPVLKAEGTFDISYTLPKGTFKSNGLIDFKLVVDPKNLCAEFNESNNSAIISALAMTVGMGVELSANGVVSNFGSTVSNKPLGTSEYYDQMKVLNFGTAKNTTVYAGGKMIVSSGGNASDTVIETAGDMIVSRGGSANGIYLSGIAYSGYSKEARLHISSGGYVQKATASAGGWIYNYGGIAKDTVLTNGGYMQVYYGGVASYTQIIGGTAIVDSDKGFVYTTIDGGTLRLLGGIASNTICYNYGQIEMGSETFHRGTLNLTDGAQVITDSGAKIDFTVSGRKTSDGYLINDLSCISGTPTYTITVDNTLAAGTYNLAQGAERFSGSVIIGNGASDYGSITVNGSVFKYKGIKYQLAQSSGNLQLNIHWTPAVFVYSSGYCTTSAIELSGAYIAAGAKNSMSITSDGIASNTTVSFSGKMMVSNGGTAVKTTVSSKGMVFVYSGGKANNTVIGDVGALHLYGGARANSTTVNYGGTLNISNGAAADNTIINFGKMMVSAGGTANNATVSSKGMVFVYSTGVAAKTVINNTGVMNLYYGAAANSAVVNYGGQLHVSNGGTANNTAVKYGKVHVSNGGRLNGGTIDSNGLVFVSNGGIVSNMTIASAGTLHLYGGGKANGGTLISGGKMMVSNGGTAEKATVSSQAMAFVYAGGKFDSASIKQGGTVHIYGGGVAKKSIVSSGGKLLISAGGKADNTTVDNFGSMYISSGGSANGATVYYMGQLYVAKGAKLNNGTIRFGKTYISSGGVANNTIVSSGGLVFVSSGGKMETATVSSGGWIHLYYGGFANNATINGYGRFYVSNAASASKVTVNSNGLGFIYAGGKMNTVSVKKGGAVHVYGGGVANNATLVGGKTFVYRNGQISGTLLQSNGAALVSSGGKAVKTTVGYGGSMYIYSGATASNTTVNYLGQLSVAKGGKASDTTIKFGKVFVSSGATVNNTTVSSGGLIFVSSGGKMETAAVSSGGWIHLYYGGFANNATVNGYGRFYVSNAASANKVTVNSNGLSFIYAGGKMENSTIKKGGAVHVYGAASASKNSVAGKIYVSNGGFANQATLTSNGLAFVYKGGKMDNTTVQTKGGVHLYAGATHRGTLQIWSGATVSAYSGAKIDFTVSRRKSSDTYLINDLSRITGAPSFTITVSDYQADGTYKLAQGAASFNKSITVGNGKVNFGTVSVGKTLNYGGKRYTLNKNGGNLTLAITKLPASAAPWDAVAEASSEVAMPASTQECLWESASPAPVAENALAFPEIASGTAADLSIWQNFESNGCVSTLTENNQPVNKFELIA